MKNGQSLPISFAICSRFSSEILLLEIKFKKFKKNAASDEPPPRPAPIGIILCKWILNFLLELNFSKHLYKILSDTSELILLPEVVNWVILEVLTSIISYKEIGQKHDSISWYPDSSLLTTFNPKFSVRVKEHF